MKTKNILITAITILSCIASTQAQNVYIPNSIFKAALVNNARINTNRDTSIQVSEAAAYAGAIHVSGLGITDLTGIAAFVALDSLDCSSNQIAGLNVSANTALTYLDCSGNRLLKILQGLEGTYYIYFLDTLDVSANTALTILKCNNNGLLSLNTTGLTDLTYLDCSGNERGSFNPMTSNQWEHISSPLLNFSSNTALTYLNCSDNALSSLNVSACTALTYLDCSGNENKYDETNRLSSLDISVCKALATLICNFNILTNLNVSAFKALTYLDCSSNPLTNLNVSGCTALATLDCSRNALSSLNISSCTALIGLSCGLNSLLSLNVKNGKNRQMNFGAVGNAILCIEVDDAAWSKIYWDDKKDATAFFSEDCSGVGINTIDKSMVPQVYPNPTTGNIYLSENTNIVLTDLLGNLLLEQKNTNQLDISALPPGMYFIRVGDNLKQTFKIIKE